MQCSKCGRPLADGTRFCPHCGAAVTAVPPQADLAPTDGRPLYQTEVKGLLKSAQLTVYPDRTEMVMSAVQKLVFRHDALAAVKKGLDRINFIMADGRTEACAVGRKALHEAFFHIEQAVRPYLEQRAQQLQQAGVRYAMPSSRSGLSGMLSSGLLHVLDDRIEFIVPGGKGEVLPYTEVKAVRATAMGTLEFLLWDGTRKAFTVEKEQREELAGFFAAALAPFLEQHKAELLAQGIYFSFRSSQGFAKGTLDIYDDRLTFTPDGGQPEDVAFRDIRAVHVFDTTLDAALVNGTARSFTIDKEAQAEVRAFLEAGIAPFVAQRTEGFDDVFGQEEKLEINAGRGVFHILRQDGREITPEYALADLEQVAAVEAKAGLDIVSTLFTARGEDAKPAEERVSSLGVVLTVRTAQGSTELPVRFGSFSFGAVRTGPDYARVAAGRDRLFAWLEEHLPACTRVLPAPVPAAGDIVPAAADAEAAAPAAAAAGGTAAPEAAAAPAAGGVEKSQFGTLVDGIADFAARCATPMTVAIQGDWETGSGSFMRMIYDALAQKDPGSTLWLYTWQFSQFDLGEQLPMLLGDKLVELLGGAINEEARTRAKMLAQGVISIASGLLSQGSSDGQKLTDALFRDDLASTLEQKVRLFTELARRKAGDGRVIIFVDDLNRLAPAKAAQLLDALRYFFDCPGCVFMVAVDRETVLRGRRALGDAEFNEEKANAYFGRLFKTAFRVPQGSLDVGKYIADNLDRAGLGQAAPQELEHYGALARLSVGSDPKALERLFNSLLLLKSLAGEAAFATAPQRLALFGLLCMQSRFPAAYRCLVQAQAALDPAAVAALATGSPIEAQAGMDATAAQDFRAFAAALCAAIGADGGPALPDQVFGVFRQALATSAITALQ